MDVTEAEVHNMVESLNDTFTIQAIRLGRDRLTGASRGFGFIVSSEAHAGHADVRAFCQGIPDHRRLQEVYGEPRFCGFAHTTISAVDELQQRADAGISIWPRWCSFGLDV